MNDKIVTDHPLTLSEQQILRRVAALIIPPSEEFALPGADDEQIFADILQIASIMLTDIQTSLEFIAEQNLDLSSPAATAALEGQAEIAALVSCVMQAYYRDDRVAASLDMRPGPPFPIGYELEPGDWSILEAVQARGKIWRNVNAN